MIGVLNCRFRARGRFRSQLQSDRQPRRPAPVTFEVLVKRLRPDASDEDRNAAVWHLVDKLEGGLRKSIGFYTLVVKCDRRPPV